MNSVNAIDEANAILTITCPECGTEHDVEAEAEMEVFEA